MGVFCMIAGILIFVASLLAGYLLASMLVMEGFLNVLSGASIQLSQLFQAPTSENIGTFALCVGVVGFIGLVIGLGLFMNGLIYRKMNDVEYRLYRLSRKSH